MRRTLGIRFLSLAIVAGSVALACVPAGADTREKDGGRTFSNTAGGLIDFLTSPESTPKPNVRHATHAKPRPQVASKPQAPQPKVAAMPQPPSRPPVAVKMQAQPQTHLAATPPIVVRPPIAAMAPRIAKERVASKIRPARVVANDMSSPFELQPRPGRQLRANASRPQIARLQSLPAVISKIGSQAAGTPKSFAALNFSEDAQKPHAKAPRVVAITVSVLMKPAPKRRRKPFKPAQGGHGIAIVRPWQGSIPDTYCDLPTGCAATSSAPVAPTVMASADPQK